jgi:uncharacterized repeat protein (TIGR01451 family)
MMALIGALAAPLDTAQAQAGFTDMSVTASDSPDPVTPDGNITYTVTVTNHGPDASPATFEIQGANTLRFVSLTAPAGWSCAAPPPGATPTMNCSHASASAGASNVFTLIAQADSGLLGPNDTTIQTTFNVSAGLPDVNPGNDSETETTAYVTPDADLAITLSGPATANHSDQITYSYTASNNGPDAAVNVAVTAGPQPGMTFVSLAAPGGWSCTTPAVGADGPVVCTKATMSSGETGDFTLVSVAPSSGPMALALATIVSAIADPNAANNSANATTLLSSPAPQIADVTPSSGPATGGTTVTISGDNFTGATSVTFGGAPATAFAVITDESISATAPAGTGEVEVTVTTPVGTAESGAETFTYLGGPVIGITGPGGPVHAGDNLQLTITVTNSNAASLQGVMLDWTVPSGLSYVSATPSQGTATSGDATIGTLAPGASATVVLELNATSGGDYTVDVTASASNGGPSNDDSAGFTVLSTADLSVTVSGPASVEAGQTLTLTIGTSNAGPDAASNVTLTNVLPAALTFQSLSAPAGWSCTTPAVGANGTVTCTRAALGDGSGSFTLVTNVAANASGTISNSATITADTNDPSAASNSSTAVVAVTQPAPTADDMTVNVAYDTAATIDLDVSGAVTSVAVASGPAHGTTTVSGTTITYTPTAGYYGADSFIYTATGPGGTSAPATVSLTVATPPAPTVAARNGIAVPYNSSGTAIDLDSSVTGVYSSLAVSTGPSHGAVSVTGSVVTYTPTAGYYGADSFSYTATGPGGTSAPAAVSLTVATPAAPTAADKNGVAIPYNSSGTAIDLDSSVTGAYSSLAVATQPDHGTVSVSGSVVTYTPTADYYGADSFTYTATGPGGTSAPATVSLTVATPPAPVASDASATIPFGYENGTAGYWIDVEVSGAYTSLDVVSPAAHGSVELLAGRFSYEMFPGFYGQDSFTYTATGPGGVSNEATVTITVSTPDAPTVQNPPAVSLTITEAQPTPTAAIDLANQVSGVFTGITVGTPPAHGSLSLSTTPREMQGPLVVATYTADADYTGTDTFTFVATGPGGDSAPGTVTIDIAGTTPTLEPLQAQTSGGVPVTVDLTAEADQGPFTAAAIVSVGPSDSGTATLVEGGTAGNRTYQLTFQPTGAFTGTAVVTYTLSNRFGPTQGTVTIEVIARANPTYTSSVVNVQMTMSKSISSSAEAQIKNVFVELMSRTLNLDPLVGFDSSLRGADSSVSLRTAGGGNPGGGDDAITDAGDGIGGDDDGSTGGDGDEDADEERKKKKAKEGSRKNFANSGAAIDTSGLRFTGLSDLPPPNLEGPFPGITARLESEHARDEWFLNVERNDAAPEPSGGGLPSAIPGAPGATRAWVGGSISFGRRDGAGAADLTLVTTGISLGVDTVLNGAVLVGAGGGYSRDVTDIGRGGPEVESTSWSGFVYGSVAPIEGAFLHGVLGAGQINFEVDRPIPETGAIARAERDGDMLFGAISSGFERGEATWRLSSYGEISFTHGELDAYTEEGGGIYGLSYDARDVNSLVGLLGVRGQRVYELRSGVVMPRGWLEILHEFGDEEGQKVRYADWVGGPTYLVPGLSSARDRIRIGLGNSAILTNGWTVDVDAEAELAKDMALGTFRLKAAKAF